MPRPIRKNINNKIESKTGIDRGKGEGKTLKHSRHNLYSLSSFFFSSSFLTVFMSFSLYHFSILMTNFPVQKINFQSYLFHGRFRITYRTNCIITFDFIRIVNILAPS